MATRAKDHFDDPAKYVYDSLYRATVLGLSVWGILAADTLNETPVKGNAT